MIKVDITGTLKKAVSKQGITETDLKPVLSKANKGIKKLEQKRKKHELGFFDVYKASNTVEKVKQYAKKVEGKFENLIIIGIGGSSLGIQALCQALIPINWNNRSEKNRKKKPKIFFVDHLDTEYIDELLTSLDIKKTLFIVISKSGSTIEPMSLFFALKDYLNNKIGKQAWTKNVVTISDPQKGLLREISEKENLETFEIPKNIGGRYSALTAVGLLPMALLGINIDKILEGCKEADKNFWHKSSKNPVVELAATQYILDKKRGKNITVFFPYSKKLGKVADWYIQLMAESIGKNEEVGPTPIKAVGPSDQHSQMQLFMEGPNNKFILFLGVEKPGGDFKIPKSKEMQHLDYLGGKTVHQILNAEMQANRQALTEMKRPNALISIEEVNEKSIGMLLYILQCQVALLGELYKVNAFNQPGVELSKKLTKKYL